MRWEYQIWNWIIYLWNKDEKEKLNSELLIEIYYQMKIFIIRINNINIIIWNYLRYKDYNKELKYWIEF